MRLIRSDILTWGEKFSNAMDTLLFPYLLSPRQRGDECECGACLYLRPHLVKGGDAKVAPQSIHAPNLIAGHRGADDSIIKLNMCYFTCRSSHVKYVQLIFLS